MSKKPISNWEAFRIAEAVGVIIFSVLFGLFWFFK